MRGRRLPPAGLRGARLQRRRARPEDLQRRGHPVASFKFDEVTPGLPGDDTDDHARFIEAAVSTATGRAARGVDLSAQRQPARTPKNIHTNSNGWSGFLNYAHERLQLEEPLILAGDYNVIPTAGRRPQSGGLGQRRAVPAADPGEVPRARQPGPDRRDPRRQRRPRALHVLGLPGRRLAEELGHPHRPPAAVAAGRRPAHRRRHRQACALLGEAVRPRAGLCRSGDRRAT